MDAQLDIPFAPRPRLGYLQRWIAEIEKLLADPGYIDRFSRASEFDEWKSATKYRLRDLRAEATRIEQWLRDEDAREQAEHAAFWALP